jgi:hypothetical protein
VRGHDEGVRVGGAQTYDRADNLRNDVAGLPNYDSIPYTHAFPCNFARIMKCCHLHRGSRNSYGLHVAERGYPARPPDVDLDIKQSSGGFLWGVLESDSPSRRTAGRSKPTLHVDTINLHNGSVDVEPDRMSLLTVSVDKFPHFVQTWHNFKPLVSRQTKIG